MYAAPVRVSAILFAVVFVAARTDIVPGVMRDAVDVVRAFVVPLCGRITDVRVRVTESVRGAEIDNVPAREATVFWARVCAGVRVASTAERAAVGVRDCVAVPRPGWVDDTPSRTADNAGVQAQKPRNAPKIRIFFISKQMLAKIINFGQGKNKIFIIKARTFLCGLKK